MSAVAIPTSVAHAKPHHHINPWIIALAVTLAPFMEVLDTTIVNVALPHVAGTVGASQEESTWVLTSYLVSNAIVLPISGWLANVLGRKRFYMICVALFVISSFLCGLAPSLGWLIVFRVLQGIGGGGLQPSQQAILVDAFPPAKRGQAFAMVGMATVLAPAIGPTLGGWLTDNFSWRWCFYVNVPVGIVALLLSGSLLTESAKKITTKFRDIDFTGLGLIAVGLGCLQVVLDKGQQEDWFQSAFIRYFALAAILGCVGATLWELFITRNPVVDLRLLKNRNLLGGSVLLFFLGFALFGSTLLLPQIAQTQLGYTATQAGMVISPAGLLMAFLMPMIGFAVTRVQPRTLIRIGLLGSGAALIHMAYTFGPTMAFRDLVWARIYQGLALAFMFVPISTAAYATLPPGKNNNASALLALFRNLGGSFGIALVTTFLARQAQVHQSTLVEHLTPFDERYRSALANLTQVYQTSGLSFADAQQHALARLGAMATRQAYAIAYNDCFFVLGCVLIALIPLTFIIAKGRGGKSAGGGH
ncbi:MAG: DHA2 family efflux MFS transporter permease subunit [Tepidisphaeraceae bacterium]